MIIDCHAHFEPRMLDLAGVKEKMLLAGVDRIALIPCLNDPLPDTPEALLTLVRVLMQRRATRRLAEAVHRSTLTKEGNLKLKGQVMRIYGQPDNGALAKVLAEDPKSFFGWIFLNPKVDFQVLDTLERWRHEPGFVGVKLHPHWHDYPTEMLLPLLKRCEELGLPVLIHLGFGRRGDWRTMASRFPKLRLIAAHAGMPYFADLWHYKNAYPNLYVDLSSPYLDEPLARRAVEAMGPERCLYGTDAPYGFEGEDESYDYGHIQGWIDRLPIRDAQRDAIFGQTFAELIGL